MAKGDDQFAERFHEKRRRRERYQKTLPTGEQPPLPPPVKPIHQPQAEPRRNDPCPCGSGKKYKHCHGKQA